MQPGTKRIAFGGLALAVVAWGAIHAWWPEVPAPAPEARDGDGLKPIPEVATRAPRSAPAAPTAAPDAQRVAIEAVLVGCFRGMREDGAVLTERYWLATDGAFEGEFREVNHDGTPAFHETLRIARDGDGWRYHPAPFGTPAAVSFALVEHGNDALRFANPDHDFPQTIAYRRRGDELATEVAGVEDGAAKSDSYTTRREPCR